MKRVILLLTIMLMAFSQTQAQFDNPSLAYGFALGAAKGDNAGADKWGVQYSGLLQYNIFAPYILGQLSAGYTKLNAEEVYTAGTVLAANRLLFIPFSMEEVNPYLYGGFGVSKQIDESGSDFLPMVPFGVGIQTRLGSQMLLEVSGGYNLSLSDKLDGRVRSENNLNSMTNKKNDGFTSFLIGVMFTGPSLNSDIDNDGLTSKFEKELGTDPKNPDTDNDGLNDGAEVNQYKSNPLKPDTDSDALNDGDEVNQYKSDLLKPDTDGDALNDGAEVNQYKTDLLETDTDNDGLNDGAEVTQYKSDPLRSDTDNDGLNDGAEVTYKSDLLKMDTDNDALNDGPEVNQYKTDPAKSDTDGDNLADGEEVTTHKTDPVKIDTDNGSVNDGSEVKLGTNPLIATDDIAKPIIVFEKGKKVILRGVNFEFNKAILTLDSEFILEEAYKALVASSDIQVEVSGHTDNVGSDQYNQNLSLRRAQAVKIWLVKKGITSNRMKTSGKGELEPIASNETSEGQAENRRIEFFVMQ